MGRKLMRVPIGFDGPINKTWTGYVPPDGLSDEDLERWDAEDRYEPPVGDGYQLWETTSDGSPLSPVFATLDQLCAWAAENATTFANFTATKEEWRKMLSEDFVYHDTGNGLVFS